MPELLRSLFFHNASDMPGQGGKNAVFLKGMASAAETIAVFCGKRRQKFCFNGIIPERDGICRFSKVFDRGPSITEEDGCTEFVIRHTY